MKDALDNYDIVLYHEFPTRSTRVKWLLVELRLDERVETKYVNLMKGEHKSASYLALNPLGAVPTLTLTHKESGEVTVITESTAICLFLAQVSGQRSLQPDVENILAMAVYHRVIAFVGATVDPLLWDVRVNEQLLPPDRRQPKVAEKAREAYKMKAVPFFENIIANGFVTAPHHNQFTTADVILVYTLSWADIFGLNSPPLRAYMRQMLQRESFWKVKTDAPRSLSPSASLGTGAA